MINASILKKWNTLLYESQKIIVFNKKFLLLTFLTSKNVKTQKRKKKKKKNFIG